MLIPNCRQNNLMHTQLSDRWRLH